MLYLQANRETQQILTARRNCSISPRGLCRVFLGIAAVSLLIAGTFAAIGAWWVFPFTGLELTALAAAFVCWGQHVGDYESIGVDADRLWVEVRDGGQVRRHEFNPRWATLVVERAGLRQRLAVRSHGRELEIGRLLDDAGRERLATELGRWLSRAR